jgi:hypothetical protein
MKKRLQLTASLFISHLGLSRQFHASFTLENKKKYEFVATTIPVKCRLWLCSVLMDVLNQVFALFSITPVLGEFRRSQLCLSPV